MTKYEQIVNWFQDNIVIAIILIALAILMAIPQVKEGLLCVWRWVRPKKKPSPDDPFEITVKGETITFDELVRSTTLDIVRVNAHTHKLGVRAEHAWVSKRYPESEFKQQALWFLKPDDDDTAEGKAFDIITFQCADGQQKQVYFDITSFFDGKVSSMAKPSEFARKKLKDIYGI